MNSDQCSIILVDRENDCFLRMKDKEKQLNQIKNLTIGIVGRCLQTNQVIEISQGKRDIDFNRFIDIETDLPLLTFPITLKDEIIGIAQIINLRKRVGEKFLKKSFFSEKECLDVFSNILGVCLGKLLKKI